MIETKTVPVVRLRAHHVHTLKDGWRLDETTVEITGDLEALQSEYGALMKALLQSVHMDGLEESQRRSAVEARLKEQS